MGVPMKNRGILKESAVTFGKIQFSDQYENFTKTRDQLEQEGLWDHLNKQAMTSEEQFKFSELECQLLDEGVVTGSERTSTTASEVQIPEQQMLQDNRQSRHLISSGVLPQVTISVASANRHDSGLCSLATSQEIPYSGIALGREINKEDSVGADLSEAADNNRFNVNLQEARNAEGEPQTNGDLEMDTIHKIKHRTGVSNAVRRLLTERLLSSDISQTGSIINTTGGLHSNAGRRAITLVKGLSPLQKRSKSETNFRKTNVKKGGKHNETNAGISKLRLCPVGELDTGNKGWITTGTLTQQMKEAYNGESISNFRQRFQDSLTNNQLSPVRQSSIIDRSRLNKLENTLQVKNHGTDKRLYNKLLKQRVATRSAFVLPRRLHPGDRHGFMNKAEKNDTLKTNGTECSQRADLTWTYNLPSNSSRIYKKPTTECLQFSRGLTLPNIDDLRLRRLLEELYKDKKYMDKIIKTTARDKTEIDVSLKLKDGRDYLLQRAQYWLEKGPLPPRPPTTDLGLRLQRSQQPQGWKNQQHSIETVNVRVPPLSGAHQPPPQNHHGDDFYSTVDSNSTNVSQTSNIEHNR